MSMNFVTVNKDLTKINMEIRWYGKNCFTITEAKVNVVLNPTEGNSPEITDEDVVISTNGNLKGIKGKCFDWPGEYETKNVLVHSIAIQFGKDEARVISFEFEGIRICHLGQITEGLKSEIVGELGNVDILILPLTLKTKDAVKLIEEIDPKKVIISMIGEDETTPLPEILKEIGQSGLEALSKLVVKQRSDLDTENIEYVILEKS
jgi:L-ascorbate metabolism protein UlaG (beta-lactamase superfamily)